MLTREQAESLNLGIRISDKAIICIETALDLILERTSIEVNCDNLQELPARAKLFIIKYLELESLQTGVASESISKLSQSFTTDKNAALNNLLLEILGGDLLPDVKFIAAGNRWR